MTDTHEINLEEMLADIGPNLVTPHLDQLTSAQNNQKAKVLSEIIITSLADSLTDPIQKEILHEGEIHHIRFVNVEPLLVGPWANLSLVLLSLSYGEQATIIDAVYPKRLQLNAKAFAVAFTKGLNIAQVTVEQDSELIDRVDSANAGIAMILAILKDTGHIPHADEIQKNRTAMRELVEANKEREEYQKNLAKSKEVAKKRDQQM